MSILSGQSIRAARILEPLHERTAEHGLTYGLGPAGYDLRLDLGPVYPVQRWLEPGHFLLGATLEHFTMPRDILGRVCDKSSLARKGVSVFNTVIEPGWMGFLTLEIVNHSRSAVELRQGQGIAQVIFEMLDQPAEHPYDGKYQNQEAGPQEARK